MTTERNPTSAMDTLKGTIKTVTYHNPSNGYCVLRITSSKKSWNDVDTVVGYLLNAKKGMNIIASGEWFIHGTYGYQFKAETITEELPSTKEGIQNYLSGGSVYGIGPKYAKIIVDAFGENTFNVIDNEPEKLKELPGLGEKRVDRIIKNWKSTEGVRDIMAFLQSYGITPNLAKKIYKKYEEKSAEKVKENPYRLANDLWGVGFKRADDIARSMGYAYDDPRRIKAGIYYTIESLCTQKGHVCVEEYEFLNEAERILGPYLNQIKSVTLNMLKSGQLFYEKANRSFYLPRMKRAEDGIVEIIKRRKAVTPDPAAISIEKAQEESGITYEDRQVKAIRASFDSNMTVITGGPGTGKTTIMKAIAWGFQKAGKSVQLAAPTGKAAKRLSESTGMEAKTIHRLLEFNVADNSFGKDELHPLPGDVLIIDESSMIDLQLFYSLMRAVPNNMRLIMVGDVDQLPSVAPGNVLADIIRSGCCETVRLNVPFRQAAESDIISNAHKVNSGRYNALNLDGLNDFMYIESENQTEAMNKILQLSTHWIPNQYGFTKDDIQVLTPMKKGDAGTENLNKVMQEALNPDGCEVKIGFHSYRIGDHVMQLRNNYEKEVFNGDGGIITGIDDIDETVTVDFDGRQITYTYDDMEELTLSYAITIHKSQGSEYPVVIIPLLNSHYIMLKRNLLYTGITRGKKLVVLVGERQSIRMAVNNKEDSKRNTGLERKLRNI